MTVQSALTLQTIHAPSRARSWRGRSQRSKPADRGGSVTRRARPSSEVELREESAPEPMEPKELIGDIFAGCAADLVSDLVGDAIDEIVVDDLVHDEDMLAPSPTMTRHVDCMLTVDAMNNFGDSYEEVYSLVSDSCDEYEEMMEDVEELAYASMARTLAQNAVSKGCLQIANTWGDEDEEETHSMQISGMTHEPRTSNEGETNSEASDMIDPALCDFGDALFDNALYDMEVDASDEAIGFMCEDDASDEATGSMCEDDASVEAIGFMCEDFVESGCFASDMVGSIMEDAYDEAIVTWGEQISNEMDEEIELKMRVRSTLVRGLHSGELVKALKFCVGSDRVGASQKGVRNVATDDGPHEQVHNAPSEAASLLKIADAIEQAVRRSAPSAPVQQTPQTPTRTRRRIIGAIARAPAANQEQENAVASSDMISSTSSTRRQHKSHSKTTRKPKNKVPETFNMDLSGGEESTKMRGSSLTRNYDTLGAPIFSLYVADEWQSSPSDMPSPKHSTRFTQQQKTKMMDVDLGKFAYDRAMSKASARLRAASTSAMAMDLGQAGNEIASPFPAASEIFSADKLTMLSGATWGKTSSPGFSVTRKTKLAGGGLLPTLHSKRSSVESIAHTMQMSKTATKWCVPGLHGSASAVF